jgi:hypothetical protein
MLPRRRVVDLPERLENGAVLFGGNPDPAIFDGDL